MRKFEAYILLLLLTLASCRQKTTWEYMPDMADQPSIKTQEKMLRPPLGSIARGFSAYPYKKEEGEKAGRELKNPLRPTMKTLKRGQAQYTIYCGVCHGEKGDGNGSIVPKFPKPPAVTSAKIRAWRDGQIFHTMTMGQNLMPSYAVQIPEADRWALVHYVRVLQKAAAPSPADFKRARALQMKSLEAPASKEPL